MKKINIKILKEIRNNCMKEYEVDTPIELNLYHHIEFTDDAERILKRMHDFNDLEVASINNLFVTDNNGEIIDDMLDKELVLYHNKGSIPFNLKIEELSQLGFSHSWIMYNGLYYDAECLEGVNKLFDLPYYRRVLKSN